MLWTKVLLATSLPARPLEGFLIHYLSDSHKHSPLLLWLGGWWGQARLWGWGPGWW